MWKGECLRAQRSCCAIHEADDDRPNAAVAAQDLAELEVATQRRVHPGCAHIALTVPNAEGCDRTVGDVEVEAFHDSANREVEILQVGQMGIVASDPLVDLTTDHCRRRAQAVSMKEELAQPGNTREIREPQRHREIIEALGRLVEIVDKHRQTEQRTDIGMGVEEGDLRLQPITKCPVIRVENRDIFATRPADRGVHRAGNAEVAGKLDKLDPLIREATQNRKCIVCLGIVGDDQLEVLEARNIGVWLTAAAKR